MECRQEFDLVGFFLLKYKREKINKNDKMNIFFIDMWPTLKSVSMVINFIQVLLDSWRRLNLALKIKNRFFKSVIHQFLFWSNNEKHWWSYISLFWVNSTCTEKSLVACFFKTTLQNHFLLSKYSLYHLNQG